MAERKRRGGGDGGQHPDRLVTPAEACRQLSVSRNTLNAWMTSGYVSSVLFGQRCRRIPQSALDELKRGANGKGGAS